MRSCTRMCHLAGGELKQIQFLLRHESVQTPERYVGCKQRIRQAANDRIDPASGPIYAVCQSDAETRRTHQQQNSTFH